MSDIGLDQTPPGQLAQPNTSDDAVISTPASPPIISIDSFSKVFAIGLAFVYVSGFLITSLHNFRYGFSEMNPLRPRILAAGGWFAIFLGVPYTIVWELRKHFRWEGSRSQKVLKATIAYLGSASLLQFASLPLFNFDGIPDQSWSERAGAVLVAVLGALIVIALSVVVVRVIEWLKLNIREWIVPSLLFAACALNLVLGWKYILSKGQFSENATSFWLILVGLIFYFEIAGRGKSLQTRHWRSVLVAYLFLMTVFATAYYPHIKAKWGGGSLIPVELNDSSGSGIDCSLIDETDAGFYVIGKQDTFATFIPRANITSIYYGQGTGHLIFAPASAIKPHPATQGNEPSSPIVTHQER